MCPSNSLEETIEIVVNRLSSRYIFGSYLLEDIKQQGRLFALEAVPRWDGVRPLENFLYRHVKNRLGNLKRDKFRRNDPPCHECFEAVDVSTCHGGSGVCRRHADYEKRNEAKACLARLATAEPESPPRGKEMEPSEVACLRESLSLIEEKLPIELRGDYLRMRAGAKLPRARRELVEKEVRLILGFDS